MSSFLLSPFQMIIDLLAPSSRGAASEEPDTEGLDESSILDLKVAGLEARIKTITARSRSGSMMVGTVLLVSILVAIFGPYFYPQSNEIRLFAFGAAGYAFILLFFSKFASATRLTSLAQEVDVLKARKRIISRSAGGPPTSSTTEQPTSYFDRLVDINVTNLAAYYSLIKVHTNNSFLVSIAAGGIGFILILTGLIIGFTNLQNSQTITYVATGAGVVTEFISGVFFYLYNRTVRQMKEYHDSLLTVQNILLSFKIVGDTKDEAEKVKMVAAMLAFLVGQHARVPETELAKAGGAGAQSQ
jgi:hypothetical protein